MTVAADVRIYTTPWCPYCIRAKKLLKTKGVDYEDFNVAHDQELRAKIFEQTGRRTVPQIFINDEPIGGCDDLYALDAKGKLDALLATAP